MLCIVILIEDDGKIAYPRAHEMGQETHDLFYLHITHIIITKHHYYIIMFTLRKQQKITQSLLFILIKLSHLSKKLWARSFDNLVTQQLCNIAQRGFFFF